jgi:selenide,water dikinase
LADEDSAAEACRWMKQLNGKAALVLAKYQVNACTDITGFGLAGHLYEMTGGSLVDAEIKFSALPFIQQVKELAVAGAIPAGTVNNLQHYGQWITWEAVLSETEKLMFCDAQTSGGLLVSVPAVFAGEVLAELVRQGVECAVAIGRVTGKGVGIINVV